MYQVKLVKTENSHVLLPVCQRFVTTRCNITCPDDGSIIELATVSKFKGSIFSVHQFWGFAIVLTIFWISQAITWGLQDPICFDLLGDYILYTNYLLFYSTKKSVYIYIYILA